MDDSGIGIDPNFFAGIAVYGGFESDFWDFLESELVSEISEIEHHWFQSFEI